MRLERNRLKIRQFRSEYEKLEAQDNRKRGSAQRLRRKQVSFGGADNNNLQIRAFEAQIESHVKRIAYYVQYTLRIISASTVHWQELKIKC